MHRPRIVSRGARRSGKTLVLFVLLLPVVLGMVGLVLDTGQLLAAHRQAQNVADAAALAAANELNAGNSIADAQSRTCAFLGMTPTLNCPPQQGPYTGNTMYFEAVVTLSVTTWFVTAVGAPQQVTVSARAVAGLETLLGTDQLQVYLVE